MVTSTTHCTLTCGTSPPAFLSSVQLSHHSTPYPPPLTPYLLPHTLTATFTSLPHTHHHRTQQRQEFTIKSTFSV
ncbi:hypothetical protein Pmani_038775 [Petrolisthes manimaculis]|uniref:Uncharacterized protein n=1 Tax=Petrolisthes manimaculis TaxID=1843537 RepID=A0AAE1TM04_9EUCA|nr:hypothetical protein Pmani_038775 [Petrolisthes manimaculis]